MTKQAMNSIGLYKGNNPSKIEALLKYQSKSVVSELMDYFKAKDIHDLAIRLSLGK